MSSSADYSPVVQDDLSASIAISTAQSATIDLKGTQLCGLHMPSAFSGSSVKIMASPDGVATFNPVQSAGADFVLTVAASKYVPIENLALIAGLRFIQIQSNATEAAARTITLATRPL